MSHEPSPPSSPSPDEAPAFAAERPILTVQQHILLEQTRFPGASGEFSWLLSGITLAAKMISARVRRAGLTDSLGAVGGQNIQGETQQKLDVYANQVLMHCLAVRESVAVLASEENEHPQLIDAGEARSKYKYVVVFDPLDGSSNIDVNVSVGTTFSILKRRSADDGTAEVMDDVLQPGHRQVAAGYVLYGSSTVLVYTAGNGVHGFTLDPSVGAFVLSHENIRIPGRGPYYSVNEAHLGSFPPAWRNYIERLRSGDAGGKYSSRYVGSMVADVHRTLIRGGVFLYPPTLDNPSGKLRLLYEANPVAFLVEQAGGRATDGNRRILDIEPDSIHQRTPLILGGLTEVLEFDRTPGER
jgi:fructose-1,6-bisphosphatase I